MARSGHPRIDPTWSAALVVVARHGIAEGPPASRGEPLPSPAWDELLREAQRERLTGLLTSALDDGALAATVPQRDQALAAHRHATFLNLALEAILVDAVELLTSAGIDHRVLKGPSLARLDYSNPGLRCFTDVDLLIQSADFDAAIALLTDAHLVRAGPQLHEGFERRFAKGVTLVTPDGLTLDVHRTLDRGPFGLLVRLEDLWEEPVLFALAGAELRALPAEQRLLSVCFHAALGDVTPRLGPLRDVAELLLGGRVNDARVLKLSTAWRADAVLALALRVAWTSLGLADDPPLVAWARHHRLTRWERSTLDLYLDPTESHLAQALAMLRLIPGLRSKAAYARAITFPAPDYLLDRNRRRLGHWSMVRGPWRRRSS